MQVLAAIALFVTLSAPFSNTSDSTLAVKMADEKGERPSLRVS